MILDHENLLSDDQAVTATAPSTNVIDLGGENIGEMSPGEPLDILCQVSLADFSGGTSIAVSLQSSVDEAFSSPVTHLSTPAIVLASLVAGYKFGLGKVPEGLNRYVRLNYTVVGVMADGAITAGLVDTVQANG